MLRMGACGEDGADYQVVGVFPLGFQGTLVIVYGATYDDSVAYKGASIRTDAGPLRPDERHRQLLQKGHIHPLVDYEQGVAVYCLSNLHCKV